MISYSLGGGGNIPPVVTITSPGEGDVFADGDDVVISADATDNDGQVTLVEFYDGATKVGESSEVPFDFTWLAPSVGQHSLTAIVTDDEGATRTSSIVSLTISGPNVAPEVSLTIDNSIYNANEAIIFTALTSDVDGQVTQVEFYMGQTKIGEDFTAPFSMTLASPGAGTYQFSAVVTDDDGSQTTSDVVAATVLTENVLPTVSLLTPFDSDNFAEGSDVTLQADAFDVDGQIIKVEFYQGTTKIGEVLDAPYDMVWLSPASGAYQLKAVAIDDVGGVSESPIVNISVGNSIVLQEGLNGYSGVRDVYLSFYSPENNFEGTAVLNERINNLYHYRTLLHFPIFQSEGGTVPDGATIESATLSLYKSSYYNYDYGAHRILKDWVASEVTWTQSRQGVPWSVAGADSVGGDISSTVDGSGSAGWTPGWMDIDVTSGVQAIAGGASNFGWRLVGTAGNNNLKKFHSSEYTTQPTLRPKLIINYSM